MTSLGPEPEESWELTYPRGFFLTVLREAVDSLRKHWAENPINPYEAYDFQTLWYGRLK